MRTVEEDKLHFSDYDGDPGPKGAPKGGLMAPRGEREERYYQRPREWHSRSPQGEARGHNAGKWGHRQPRCPEPISRSVSLVGATPINPEINGRPPRGQDSRRSNTVVIDGSLPQRHRGRTPREAWACRAPLSKRRCHDCRRPGHGWRQCPRREAERERVVHLVASQSPKGSSRGWRVEPRRSETGTRACPLPVTPGTVALTEDGPEVKIRVLRDTGAEQTLLRAGKLPLPPLSPGAPKVRLSTFGGELGPFPLRDVYLRTRQATGRAAVVVMDKLPERLEELGVSLVLGNDVAGVELGEPTRESPVSRVVGVARVDAGTQTIEEQVPGSPLGLAGTLMHHLPPGPD